MVTTDHVLTVLRQVIDPELGINIVDLGLVYDVTVDDGDVNIDMTMTTPACPIAGTLTQQAEMVILRTFSDVRAVTIELVWEPEWNPMMMSWEARAVFGQ